MISILFTPKKPVKPLPFAVYYWTVALIGLGGLAVSIYLAFSHYRVYTDLGYSSFCAISQAINCDTVSESRYSIFLGMPLPEWGIVAFALFLLLLVFAYQARAERKRMWSLLFLIALAYSLISIVLALISTFLIYSHCIMCIAIFGINFLLLFYTWLIRRRFAGDRIVRGAAEDIRFLRQSGRQNAVVLVFFGVGTIMVWALFPAYWNIEPPELATDLPTGVTAEGHPWIGARNPKLVITEFSDYMCFQCSKSHYFLRQMMVKYPGKIRLIHRQFPMDHKVNPLVKKPFHVGSGAMSMLAVFAGTRGKFWQMNDLLFKNARRVSWIDYDFLSQKLGLDAKELSRSISNPGIWKKLWRDIAEGLRLGINGTPTFMINGQVYRQRIPEQIITGVIQ